jgi:thioredoxin 1
MKLSLVCLFALGNVLAGCGSGAGPSSQAALIENARQSGAPTVVEFGASNCKSCREMKPILDQVARARLGRAHVVVVDLSQEWELARTYRIQLMPTQVFFDAQGQEAKRHMGPLPQGEILALLDQLAEAKP